MRILTALLSLLGLPWALIAWVLFGGWVIVIEELFAGRTWEALGMVFYSQLLAAQAGLGYYVWGRWLAITLNRSRSTTRFWLVASGHHLAWVAFCAIGYFEGDPLPRLILWYAAAQLGICVVAAYATRPRPLRASV